MKTKLVILGQTPPPFHGQAVGTQMLFDHEWNDYDAECIRMAYSDEIIDVGKFRFSKISHLFSLIRKTRKALKGGKDPILFYPPSSAKWTPFLRDVVFLAATRGLAKDTVFIFHAAGLAEFTQAGPLRKFLSWIAYRKASFAFEVTREAISPHETFQVRRWQWCPCGVAVPTMSSRSAGRGEDALNVLFVGSLQEGKGVLEIVKTALVLRDRGHGGKFVFNVVGRWSSDRFEHEVTSLIEKEGLGDTVRILGERSGDAKWECYAQADIFFFPSHYSSEASPIVLMEALGAGLPIVSTDWRGIPAILDELPGTYACPIKSPEAYADALIELSSDRAKLTSYAEELRKSYEARYCPEHFLGKIESGLRQVRDDGRKRPSVHVRRATVELNIEPAPDARVVIQVFNQYRDRGGEEIWVDKMFRLSTPELLIHDVRFFSSAWKRKDGPSLVKQCLLCWDNPSSRQVLAREIADLKPDALVFHNIFPVGSFGLYDEAKKAGIPVIQIVHNFRPFSPSGALWVDGAVRDEALRGNPWPEIRAGAWENSRVRTALAAFLFGRLRRSGKLNAIHVWVAISHFMRRTLEEVELPSGRLATLRHCWELTPRSPQDEGDYYLFLGRLVSEKGVRTLLNTWRILEKELGKDCPKLVIAGSGPMEKFVVSDSRESEFIEFASFVNGDEKTALISRCRGLIAPSLWWEPLGLIVYEAFAEGRPVLVANSGGLVEMVRESGGGRLHTPGDEVNLATDVKALEHMGTQGRAELGEKGYAWMQENTSVDAWRAELSAIIDSSQKPQPK